MPSHTCVCHSAPAAAAGFAQPPWPNPARNSLRLGFRARGHFDRDTWAKGGPCPASYDAVHGCERSSELAADHAKAGFGLTIMMAQTPLPVVGGMRCRCKMQAVLAHFRIDRSEDPLGPPAAWDCRTRAAARDSGWLGDQETAGYYKHLAGWIMIVTLKL
jgi:hypothetical protein